MNTFIFNADKVAMSPQQTRSGGFKRDVHGNPLRSIKVKFDTPEMKTEALKRMKEMVAFYKAAPHMFPETTQSGLDKDPSPTVKEIADLEDKILAWSKGADVFEA